MTYQEWLYAKVFGLTENLSRNFKLKDLVPKQVYDKILDNVKEGNMTYQLKRDRMTSFTAEDADVNQDMIDQVIATEIISEIIGATNRIFNEHLERHGIPATSVRSDSIANDVRKWLHDDLQPAVERKIKNEPKTKIRVDYKCKLGICKKDAIAKAIVEKFDELFEDAAESIISNQEAMYDITDEDRCDIIVMTRNKLRKAIGTATTAKEETKMVCDKDYDFMGLDCSITVDRVVYTYDGSPEYQFSGATNDIDELTKRIKNQPKREIVKIIPNRIWQNDGRHTTVEWRDGTKTTVCCEDPEKYTEWGGFCACVTKKLYGSATKAELELETAKKTTAWPAKRKELERKKLKALKQRAAQRKKEQREQKIADKMEEMRITNEAGHRLAKEYSEKETAVAVEEGIENA